MSLLAPHHPQVGQILDFTDRYPAACFHTIDMPYRLCSPSVQEPANYKVWTGAGGEMVGFGVLQLPFSTLDWAVRPGHERLQQEIVAWGVARLEQIARERGEGFGYLLDSRINDDLVAQQHGFELDDWYIRNLALEVADPPPAATPDGFHLRPLNGSAEVAAYVDLHRAAFQSRNMTVEWRIRTLSHLRYQPQLDLVAEAEDGRLAAFCIGWLGEDGGKVVGQIEPLGVLPEFQGQGLGRAILQESLRRFHSLGARHVLIDAESNNSASKHLYESAGFREIERTYKYFRRF